MNNDETKFFVINTEHLWEEYEEIVKLLVTGEGISLTKSSDYSYVETFTPRPDIPLSLDRDVCGLFYILYESKKTIFVYDIKNQESWWFECLSFKNPRSIAVSDTDIYVIDIEDLTVPAEEPPPEQPEQPEPPYSPPPPPPPPPQPPHPPHPPYPPYPPYPPQPPEPPGPPEPPHPPHPPHPPRPPKPHHLSHPSYLYKDHDGDTDQDVDKRKWKLYCLARVNGQIRWEREVPPGARIAVLDQVHLYVLDTDKKEVFKLFRGCELDDGKIMLTDEKDPQFSLDKPTDIASDREGNFYILEGQKKEKEILKFDRSGKLIQTISIPFKEDVEYLSLAVESSDNIFLGLAGETGGIIQLSKAIKYKEQGTYISKIFDSTMLGCRWHRVVLDAQIPANTRVMLSYSTTDNKDDVNKSFGNESLNPVDALMTGVIGQYLRFKIELFSDETCKNTPLIKQLRVYFPRVTYLRYLPETYQENEKKREFLERFLSLFETFMSRSEEQISDFSKYLDPAAVPGKFVPWLSSWLAIAHDENWSLEKIRRLIQQAPGLYRIRGTPHILRQIINLFYGKTPIIVEPFQFRCIKNSDIIELMKDLFGSNAYRFTVLVPPRWHDPDSPLKKAREVTAAERNTLQRIVDTEKPADTTGTLQVLKPSFYLDLHTYLGINTLLTKTEFVLGKTSVIGRDTVIYDKEKAGQLGRKSSIGLDLTLT